ncbi:TetR/AcrR family transcriptional regulator [Nocardia huaxiensis]|uniref:TetR/AcrR family transcriptional regulator n=1 Tax=Nocardia huaxiensis TaxID=2755382 RepID=UPI001E582D79|nr:TetR/AcrR family transcriptional regulator [Nocardia huaxiensis]UFS97672.1 TetR/AcrR family transcriptional regulator [Nocardia huaxiensis]
MSATPTTDDSKSRRVRMASDERRRQIVEVAQRLFSQRPYSEVSTADIAEAAGIGRPNLHYHFGTKRELYVEVVRNFARLPPIPRVRRQHGTLEERIHHTIDRWLDTVWENRGTFMTIFEGGPINNDREIEDLLEEGREAWAARLAELLELPGGATRPARALIRSFQSMAETTVDEWLRRDRLSRDEALLLLTMTLRAVAVDVAPSILDPTSPKAKQND